MQNRCQSKSGKDGAGTYREDREGSETHILLEDDPAHRDLVVKRFLKDPDPFRISVAAVGDGRGAGFYPRWIGTLDGICAGWCRAGKCRQVPVRVHPVLHLPDTDLVRFCLRIQYLKDFSSSEEMRSFPCGQISLV
jgi:hypothetical protein